MRLDEEKLEALRTWGEALRRAKGEELAATGRAIVMLVEEIDQLHIELWHARLNPSGDESISIDDDAEDEGELVESSLRARLQRVLRRESDFGAAAPEEQSAQTQGRKRSHSWSGARRRRK